MARETSISNFIEDAVKQALNKVNTLKAQEANSAIRVKELEVKRDKLSQEIFDLEKKSKIIKKESEVKAEEILKSAKEKMTKAVSREASAAAKESEFITKQKEADNLIKSNAGLEKTLQKAIEESKERVANLKKIKELIKESVGE